MNRDGRMDCLTARFRGGGEKKYGASVIKLHLIESDSSLIQSRVTVEVFGISFSKSKLK